MDFSGKRATYYALRTLGLLGLLFLVMNGSSLYAGPIKFGGGDGSSFESAVLIQGAKDEKEGIAAEHQYLSSHFGSWSLRRQSLVSQKARLYDVMDITEKNGTERSVLFDITEFFGKQ